MLQWRKLCRQTQCFALQLINILICQNITSCLCPVSNHVPKQCNQLSTDNIYMHIFVVVGEHVHAVSTPGISSEVTSATCDSDVLIQS